MENNSIKRIAFFMPHLLPGGAERVMLILANQFVSQGFQVDFLFVKAIGHFVSRLSPMINIVDMHAAKMIFSVFQLAVYLRRQKPDVLFSTLHPTNVASILAKMISRTNTRVVLRVSTTVSAQRYAPWKKWLVRQLLSFFYSRADQVIAVSNGVASDLHSYLKLDVSKISRIYNPTITQEIFDKSMEPIPHPWFTPHHAPVIIGVGRLILDKGFAHLLEAFALVRSVMPAKLVLIGDGPERLNLNNLAQKLNVQDDFSIIGFVENPFAYMKRAALFVLPSRREGLPNALIEAMACGCPVISTDSPGGAREILRDGQYGDLVPLDSSELLVDAILRNLNGNVKSVDPGWLEQFKMEYVAKQYLSVLSGGASVH